MTDSTMLVLVYPEEQVADHVMETVLRLQTEGAIDLEDACVVLKDEKGKIKIHQGHNLPLVAATGGAMIGGVLGMVFLIPYVGAAIGAAAGALGGMLADLGIDDEFIKTIGNEIGKQHSALFLLLKDPNLERAIAELAPFGGKILHTSFAPNDEELFLETFEAAQKQTQPSPDLHM